MGLGRILGFHSFRAPLGLEWILSSFCYTGQGPSKNSRGLLYREAFGEAPNEASCKSSYMSWDLDKFRALPLYRFRGTWENSELLLYRWALGEAPNEVSCESSYMFWVSRRFRPGHEMALSAVLSFLVLSIFSVDFFSLLKLVFFKLSPRYSFSVFLFVFLLLSTKPFWWFL